MLPDLPLDAWQDTYATLHMWTQIVGKVRLAFTPLVNHWWNVTLYPTARGLTTSSIPHGDGALEIRFDFLDHRLVVETSDGATRIVPLAPRAVADFHADLLGILAGLGLDVDRISGRPDEVPDPIPFAVDRRHASYDGDAAQRF